MGGWVRRGRSCGSVGPATWRGFSQHRQSGQKTIERMLARFRTRTTGNRSQVRVASFAEACCRLTFLGISDEPAFPPMNFVTTPAQTRSPSLHHNSQGASSRTQIPRLSTSTQAHTADGPSAPRFRTRFSSPKVRKRINNDPTVTIRLDVHLHLHHASRRLTEGLA